MAHSRTLVHMKVEQIARDFVTHTRGYTLRYYAAQHREARPTIVGT